MANKFKYIIWAFADIAPGVRGDDRREDDIIGYRSGPTACAAEYRSREENQGKFADRRFIARPFDACTPEEKSRAVFEHNRTARFTIKPLKWDEKDGVMLATTVFGNYWVRAWTPIPTWEFSGNGGNEDLGPIPLDSAEACRTAAERHWQAMILQALRHAK